MRRSGGCAPVRARPSPGAIQEHGVADDVTQPQPSRLLDEADEPLGSVVDKEARPPRGSARDVVEYRPAREQHVGVERAPISAEPLLLKRHTKANDENVRPRGINAGDHGFVLRAVAIEVPVIVAGDLDLWIALAQALTRFPGDPGSAADEIETVATFRAELGELPCPVGIRDPLRYPYSGEEPETQGDTETVAEDNRRLIEKLSQPGQLIREIHAVDVHVQDQLGPSFLDDCLDRPMQLRDSQKVKLGPQGVRNRRHFDKYTIPTRGILAISVLRRYFGEHCARDRVPGSGWPNSLPRHGSARFPTPKLG